MSDVNWNCIHNIVFNIIFYVKLKSWHHRLFVSQCREDSMVSEHLRQWQCDRCLIITLHSRRNRSQSISIPGEISTKLTEEPYTVTQSRQLFATSWKNSRLTKVNLSLIPPGDGSDKNGAFPWGSRVIRDLGFSIVSICWPWWGINIGAEILIVVWLVWCFDPRGIVVSLRVCEQENCFAWNAVKW